MMSVVLTPKARQFLSRMLPGHFQLMAALTSTLSESERRTLVALLNKIIERAVAIPGDGRADVLPDPAHSPDPAGGSSQAFESRIPNGPSQHSRAGLTAPLFVQPQSPPPC